MALGGIVQSLLILVIVLMYTAMVWKSLDQYFRDEFKKHLELDYRSIEKLKKAQNVHTKAQLENAHSEIEKKKTVEDTEQQHEKTHGCRQENMPADKYKNQDDILKDSLDTEVCSFDP